MLMQYDNTQHAWEIKCLVTFSYGWEGEGICLRIPHAAVFAE